MASNQPGHFIQRMTIEADLENRSKANPIQNELSRIFNNQLIHIAEKIMDEEDVPDHLLRIKGLEIDLGDLSEAYLEGDLVAAFTTKFRTALQDMKAKAGYQNPYFDRDAELIALFPAKSEFLTYFLKYGRFPSGTYGFSEKPENVLMDMIQEDPDRSRKFLKALVQKEPKVSQRIVAQFSNTTLRSVFRLFSPSYADFIQREIEQVGPEIGRVTELKRDTVRLYLKQASFDFLLQNHQILFSRKQYLTSLQERLEKMTKTPLDEVFPATQSEEEQEVLDKETKEFVEKSIERLREILKNPKARARQENLPQLWEQLVRREPEKVMELLKEVAGAPGRLLQVVEELSSELLFSLVSKTVPASSRNLIRIVTRVISAHASFLRGRQAETFFRNVVHSNLLQFLIEEPTSADKPKVFVDFLEQKLKPMPQVPEKLKEQWESFEFAEPPTSKAERERKQKAKEEEKKAAEKAAQEQQEGEAKKEQQAEEEVEKAKAAEEEARAEEAEEKAKTEQEKEQEEEQAAEKEKREAEEAQEEAAKQAEIEEVKAEEAEAEKAAAKEVQEAEEKAKAEAAEAEKAEAEAEQAEEETEARKQKTEAEQTAQEEAAKVQAEAEQSEADPASEEAGEAEKQVEAGQKEAEAEAQKEQLETEAEKEAEVSETKTEQEKKAREAEEQTRRTEESAEETAEGEVSPEDLKKGLLPNDLEEEFIEEADPEQTQVDFVLYFLREGELPWWSKNLIQPDPRIVIQALVDSKSGVFLKDFKKMVLNLPAAQRPEIAARFISRFGEDNMTTVLTGLMPNIIGFMATMALALDEYQNKGNPIPEKNYIFKGLSFRWHYVVRFYMDYGQNLPGPNEFVNYVVEMVAAGLSVPNTEVVTKLREISQEQVDNSKMRFMPLLTMLPMSGTVPALNSELAAESLRIEKGLSEAEEKEDATSAEEKPSEEETVEAEGVEGEELTEEEVAERAAARAALKAEMERVKEELRKQRGEKPKPSAEEDEKAVEEAKAAQETTESTETADEAEERVEKPLDQEETALPAKQEETAEEETKKAEATSPDKPGSKPIDGEAEERQVAAQEEEALAADTLVGKEPVGEESIAEEEVEEAQPLEKEEALPTDAEVEAESRPTEVESELEEQSAEAVEKEVGDSPQAEEPVEDEEGKEALEKEVPEEDVRDVRERPDLDELFAAFEEEEDEEEKGKEKESEEKPEASETRPPASEEAVTEGEASEGETGVSEESADETSEEEGTEVPVPENENLVVEAEASNEEKDEVGEPEKDLEGQEEEQAAEAEASPLEVVLYFLERGSLPQGTYASLNEEQTLELLEEALEVDEVRVRTAVAQLLKRPAIRYKYARLPERLLLRVLSLNLPAGSERLFISYFRNLRAFFEGFPGATAHFVAAEHIFGYFADGGPADLQVDSYLRSFLEYMSTELSQPQLDLIEFLHDQITASPSRVSVTLQEVIAAIRTEMVRPRKSPLPEAEEEKEAKETKEVEEAEEVEVVVPKEEDPEDEYIYINNAGLSLALAVLPATFKALGYLTPKGKFVNEQLRIRAVHFLAYLSHMRLNPPEEELIYNKIIVGMDIDQTLPKELTLTDDEKETAEELITMIMEKWKGIHKVSSSSFRASWLQREGRLLKEKGAKWTVRVDQTAIDRLMIGIPWPISKWSGPFSKWEIVVEWS